ncbi:MAG: calcium-binding protein, partial [Microcoleaceae cyanobacterium]
DEMYLVTAQPSNRVPANLVWSETQRLSYTENSFAFTMGNVNQHIYALDLSQPASNQTNQRLTYAVFAPSDRTMAFYDDTLIGGVGANTMAGGTGNNVYIVDFSEESGGTVITDTQGDNLVVFASNITRDSKATVSTLRDANNNLLIDLNNDNLLNPGNDLVIENFFTNPITINGIDPNQFNLSPDQGKKIAITISAINTIPFDPLNPTIPTPEVPPEDTLDNNLGGGGTGNGSNNNQGNNIGGNNRPSVDDTIDIPSPTLSGGWNSNSVSTVRPIDQAIIFGTIGNDTLFARTDSHIVFGLAGDDLLYGNDNHNDLIGGLGRDSIDGGVGDDEIVGDNLSNENSSQTRNQSEIDGDNLVLESLSNNADYLLGGDGNDSIAGGFGDDIIHGNQGNDFINGEIDNDTIYGGKDDDTILGEGGDDVIFANRGNDLVESGDQNDQIFGGKDNDTLSGNQGNDFLFGDLDNDLLAGNAGNDSLDGNSGDDTLLGGVGNDTLLGGDGNDLLSGGASDDYYTGGLGTDRFVISTEDGIATITDFADGEDLIWLNKGLTQALLTITNEGQDTVIKFDTIILAILKNTQANQITSDDFFSSIQDV